MRSDPGDVVRDKVWNKVDLAAWWRIEASVTSSVKSKYDDLLRSMALERIRDPVDDAVRAQIRQQVCDQLHEDLGYE